MFLFSMNDYMVWVWLAVFVIAIIIEASTNDLVSIWFSIGSLVSLCLSFATPIWVQVVVFVVVSGVALICTRPLVKKLMKNQIRKTNSDEFIGKRVKTIKEISKFTPGEIKINGVVYTAILPSDSDEVIKEDTVVEIITIIGNKVVVKNVEEGEK